MKSMCWGLISWLALPHLTSDSCFRPQCLATRLCWFNWLKGPDNKCSRREGGGEEDDGDDDEEGNEK